MVAILFWLTFVFDYREGREKTIFFCIYYRYYASKIFFSVFDYREDRPQLVILLTCVLRRDSARETHKSRKNGGCRSQAPYLNWILHSTSGVF